MTEVEAAVPPAPETPSGLSAGRILKWVLCLVVLIFVGQNAAALWQGDRLSTLSVEPVWLLPAALCYLIGWIPSVWFWRRMMVEFGARPGRLATLRAYYCGHLGKYVPGKAFSLVIRAGLLKPDRVPVSCSAVSATFETLGVMGVGLAVWLALAPGRLSEEVWNSLPTWLQLIREAPWVAPGVVAAGVVIVLPLSARLLSQFAWKFTPGSFRDVAAAPEEPGSIVNSGTVPDAEGTPKRISRRLLLSGAAAFVVTWALHGLSLGFSLRAVGEIPFAVSFGNWTLWTCAVAGATSAGFFAVFAPGGLGVREGLLIATLQGTVGGRTAVAAAAVYRVVCFSSELIAAGLLYLLRTGTEQKHER